jgi:N-acetylglucosamine-6-phosphate deacetylase
MPPVGSDNPTYILNGQTIVMRDGICQSEAGVLAGSGLDMAGAVRNSIEMLGLPLAEASRMASSYPAAWIGLDRTHGRIAAGYRADFAVMDDSFTVRETWVDGVAYPVA